MNRPFLFCFVFLVCSSASSFSQRLNRSERTLMENLRAHVTYLADDKLEGRRAGTQGEQLAADYISTQFQKIGLTPRGDGGVWFQPFEIYEGKQINPPTHLIINGHDLKLDKDFFPLSFSPNRSVEAAVAMALTERGVPWFFDLRELINANRDNPHADLHAGIKEKANAAAQKGASALIVFNSSSDADSVQFLSRDRSDTSLIPVIYVKPEIRKRFFSDEAATLDIKLKTDIGPKTRTGKNVIGYIHNNAPTTVVLGAHFDHLGYGEDGNSMLRTGEKQVHNGADDNASGTAALIELARKIKQSGARKSNYVFIAFSGEELGLFGSKHFTQNPTVGLDSVTYMINMDMVGRYDASKGMTVGGVGTSPAWGTAFASIKQRRPLVIKMDSSGTGPSDHSSFYRKDIPVLFFFTGLHSDYHRPGDDFDKINYAGQVQIVNYIFELLGRVPAGEKLAFTKTREQQTSTTARFSVSLGIMPDYTFSGSGVKVDGVSAGRAAEKAGIQTGDVITSLGEYNTASMENYMQALSKFRKGDKTMVTYKRGDSTLKAEVEF